MTKIAVVGATGRMGKVLITAVSANEKATLTAASVRPGGEGAGSVDAGAIAGVGDLGVLLVDDLAAVIDQCDVVIDFTTPQATLKHLEICAHANKKIVVGTTGFSPEQLKQVQTFGESHAVVFAPNFSIGVNAAFTSSASPRKFSVGMSRLISLKRITSIKLMHLLAQPCVWERSFKTRCR